MSLVRRSFVRGSALAVAVVIALLPPGSSFAQAAPARTAPESSSVVLLSETEAPSLPGVLSEQAAVLPNAPAYTPADPNSVRRTVAPLHAKYIASDETAQKLTAHDKVILGLKDLYSPLNFVAFFASSGYEQLENGSPNYGTDRGAFGERLGAAAIRETTQGIFTDAVFAPLLHEDPRYFVEGSSHNFFHRTLYAVTRPVVTRTDSGRSTVNGALLMGYASSAALSYTYYPSINRNFHDTAATFGGSLGGAALGFFVSEFSDDLLRLVHLKH